MSWRNVKSDLRHVRLLLELLAQLGLYHTGKRIANNSLLEPQRPDEVQELNRQLPSSQRMNSQAVTKNALNAR
jgi:hypothetical protein